MSSDTPPTDTAARPAATFPPPARTSSGRAAASRSALDGIDFGLAVLFAFAAGALYVATRQDRLTIDGAGLASYALSGEGHGYYNVLYLPLVRAGLALLPGPDGLDAVRAVHGLFGGCAVGGVYLFARWFVAGRAAAATAAAFWALAPGPWFFATTPENHAVHGAVAALVLVAFVHLPWRRTAVALPLAAALMPLLFWTQQVSILLGPGLVLLADHARRRVAPGSSIRRLLLVVGPTLLAGFVAALVGANLWRFGSPLPSVEGQLAQIRFDRAWSPAWWTEWLAPLGVLAWTALAALGLGGPERAGRRGAAPRSAWPHARLTFLLLLLPPAAFFSWWGVEERGGYFLGSGAIYVALGALLLERVRRNARPRPLLLGLLLLGGLQAWLGWDALRRHDTGWRPEDRVEQVRAALGDAGTLVATANIAPRLDLALPASEELLLWEACKQAQVLAGDEGRIPPDTLGPWLLRRIDAALAAGRPIALELGWRASDPRGAARIYFPQLEALEASVRARYRTEEFPHPHWPLLRILGTR